ncbi:MAG: hypothetical protein KR126chlam4_00285 [Candidatus Anoxychlamydiales bacterium]|uniref:YacP-like NYN domain protein n=1 Tax=marine sediment metagenome TaxID=412755 RepID=A0A0F9E6U1_9ZZZZ|nr:hypothetical protein [Candidatus Anoxychlamydiales bacterium]NGX40463.1 hypothetical protein [Candidatus Anoxychlamydiales bacterium]
MLYLIDGYNLLFKFFHSEKNIQTQRNLVIQLLQEKASLLKLNFHLIFDAHHQEEIVAHKSDINRLKVIYTPKGQTADDYILERVFLSKTPSQLTIVTSDNSLAFQAKNMLAQTKSIADFIDFLNEKEIQSTREKEKNKEEFIDTKHNIQRLLKIFEDKLEDNDDFD